MDISGETLIPGLPNDIALWCLARVPSVFLAVLGNVCKSWKHLVENQDFPLLRRQVGSSECWICVLPEIRESGSFLAYNPVSNKWHALPPIPGWISTECWQGFACVSIGHRLLLMGGVQHPKGAVADVKVYNACTNQWSNARSMNSPRSWFAATVIGDLVYVAGGQGKISFLDTAEVYDLKNDVWKPISNMNCVRYSCCGVTLNGQFWVIGGEYARHQYGVVPAKGSAEVYDPSSGLWALIPEMGIDIHKVPWPTTVHREQLLCVHKNRVMLYVRETNEWTHIGNVLGWEDHGSSSQVSRHGFTFESLGNEIYIIGGRQVSWFNSNRPIDKNLNTVKISTLQNQGNSKYLPWWNGENMDSSSGGTILASSVVYV